MGGGMALAVAGRKLMTGTDVVTFDSLLMGIAGWCCSRCSRWRLRLHLGLWWRWRAIVRCLRGSSGAAWCQRGCRGDRVAVMKYCRPILDYSGTLDLLTDNGRTVVRIVVATKVQQSADSLMCQSRSLFDWPDVVVSERAHSTWPVCSRSR